MSFNRAENFLEKKLNQALTNEGLEFGKEQIIANVDFELLGHVIQVIKKGYISDGSQFSFLHYIDYRDVNKFFSALTSTQAPKNLSISIMSSTKRNAKD